MSHASSPRAPHAGQPASQAASQGAGLLGGLGRACYRHRWITLLTWIIGVACLIALWQQFGAAALNTFNSSDPGQTVLNQHFPRASGDTLTLAVKSTAPVTSPAVKAQVASTLVQFERAPYVTSVSDPYTSPGQVSRDGHIAFSTVQFGIAGSSISASEATALMNDARAASGHGVTFSLGGDVVDQEETPYGGPTDGVGVIAAAVILLIAFGSLLAMGLPIATAVLGIGAGLSLIGLLGHLFPAPSFSPIIAGLIGLGVGIDYALFIVTRFREGLRAGAAPEAAAVTAMRTAGRSVLVAGITVVIGMLGLLILRQALLNGVAVAAAATVAMVLLASLTLLPALLGFSGTRLAKPSRIKPPAWTRKTTPRSDEPVRPAAERWAGVIQRHPVVATAASGAFILVLAAPALGMKLSFPDESAQARGTMGYASYATMAQGFGPGFDAPVIIAAQLPNPHAGTVLADTGRLAAAVAATPGVAAVTPVVVSRDGEAAMLIAYPATGEQDPATDTLVNRISGTVLPKATAGTGISAYVTGPNAGNVSFANLIGQRLPWLIGVVVALSMLLLLVVFRSVVIAVKAAVMNLLSITAAYGVLVMVSQNGWLGSLFGFPEKVPVTTWVPMFLFVILFGLSMDYEVFLLSRVREEYDSSGDNAAAVARGLSRTARVITAAAAIMVAVFLSIVIAPNVSTKQIGLGLAVAILVDATVVRLVLVPSVMELLGRANWWLPGWLDRLLPQASLHEDEPSALHTARRDG
jgi:putative drug exporter of the RND superfamily